MNTPSLSVTLSVTLSVADAIRQKWQSLQERKINLSDQITALERDKAALQREYFAIDRDLNVCQASAELFDVNLGADEPSQSLQPISSDTKPRQTIREIVLNAARAAYPAALRTKATREMLERDHGFQGHEKTVGMTFYRLAKDGEIRREGWDWFYIPEDQRNKDKGLADEPSPSLKETADGQS